MTRFSFYLLDRFGPVKDTVGGSGRVAATGETEFCNTIRGRSGRFDDLNGLKLDAAGLKKWWAVRGPSLMWKGENKRFE